MCAFLQSPYLPQSCRCLWRPVEVVSALAASLFPGSSAHVPATPQVCSVQGHCLKAGAGSWAACEVERNRVSRSYSLERCFSNACGQMMVSVPWSDSGSETGGFGRVLVFFFLKHDIL